MLLFSIFAVAACGLTYELLIAAVASYLLGSSVLWFSVTIGLFLSSMGVGAFLSRWLHRRLLERFVGVEVAIGILGGLTGPLLFWAYTATPHAVLVLVGATVTIGALVGLEIPLLTRYLERYGTLREAIANVLSFDYMGALLASLLFPLVLLPYLGLLKTFLAVGLLNVGVAALTLAVFRKVLAGTFALWLAIGTGAAGLTATLVRAETLMSTFEAALYRDEVVHAEQTPYQRVVLTRYRDDVRLFIDGHLQLSSRDEYRYHEPLVHPAMSLAVSREQVLVLGGGDGLVAREVLRWPDVERVVVVDLDPAITALATDHPLLRELNGDALRDPRVEVVNADAWKVLEESSELFPVIVADFPDPHSEGLARLYSTAFYRMLDRHLAPGGAAVTQATSPFFAREAFWCIAATVEAAGMTATPYHSYVPSFGEWGFVLMTAAPPDLGRVRAPSGARFLSEEVIPTLFTFPPDIGPVDVEPSQLEHPVVMRYYQEGWRRWF